MNQVPLKAILLLTVFFAFLGSFSFFAGEAPPPKQELREITGKIQKGETLSDIFRKYQLDISQLYKMREASANIYRLHELYPGRPYKIVLDKDERIDFFSYEVDDDCFLNINRTDDGYCAEKVSLPYEKRILHIGGTITDNLIASLGEGHENLLLALQLSDIFAWDIDFTTDLREQDSFKIVVEGLYLDGKLKKYGSLLAAEFSNDGEIYRAYAFRQNGKIDYYDADGKSLRKSFLKSPLSFRRISSGFSRGRAHPILKIVRPHQGIDYAAAKGTPVSAAGDGKVLFAGRRGQYGNLIIIGHRNGYKTYYGHLSRIGKGVRKGTQIDQGTVIGYVGATGLATGPHLHYEMRIADKPINPLSLKIPRGTAISGAMQTAFRQVTDRLNSELASVKPSTPVAIGQAATPKNGKAG
ncbi:MAG: peptidoglycan DD-metalloendopeptidase family protein [Deltaproteobacteria bacterium]|nr:peptidoglycan DD-metalloendopeptidase family protein [Deltaproteobacteria bacterium]